MDRKLKRQILKQSKEVLKDTERGILNLKRALQQAEVNKITAEAIIKGL